MSARAAGLLRALLAGRAAAAAPASQQQWCGLLQAQAQLHGCATSSRAVTAISSSTQPAWDGASTSGRGLPTSQQLSRGLRHGLSIGSTRGLSTKASEETIPQWLFSTIRSVPGKVRSFFPGERAPRLAPRCAAAAADGRRPPCRSPL
jgi:hypothetical protein